MYTALPQYDPKAPQRLKALVAQYNAVADKAGAVPHSQGTVLVKGVPFQDYPDYLNGMLRLRLAGFKDMEDLDAAIDRAARPPSPMGTILDDVDNRLADLRSRWRMVGRGQPGHHDGIQGPVFSNIESVSTLLLLHQNYGFSHPRKKGASEQDSTLGVVEWTDRALNMAFVETHANQLSAQVEHVADFLYGQLYKNTPGPDLKTQVFIYRPLEESRDGRDAFCYVDSEKRVYASGAAQKNREDFGLPALREMSSVPPVIDYIFHRSGVNISRSTANNPMYNDFRGFALRAM